MANQLQAATFADDTDDLRTQIVSNTTQHQFLGAGAGAGKTTVLVDHYFHLLTQGLRPAQLVAVTFTDKAAAEMKTRLREKCRQMARTARKAGGESQSRRWDKVVHELETAPISTIHGLCTRLLRENALIAGLDPDFAVLDEIDSTTLLEEVVRQTLLSRLGEEPTAREVAIALGYSEAVRHIVRLVQERVKLEQVLGDTRYDSPDDLLAAWCEGYAVAARDLVLEITGASWYAPNLAFIQGHVGPAGDRLEERREEICGIINAYRLATVDADTLDADRCTELMAGLSALRAVKAGNAGKADLWARAGCSKDEMVKAQGVFISPQGMLAAYGERLDDLRRDAQQDEKCARVTCALIAEVRAAIGAYQEAKLQRSALDFEDLIDHARRLWQEHPEALARASSSIAHVMVDEFQDTNTLQKQVLWPLVTGRPLDAQNAVGLPADGPRLFTVGDAKQSIYRFRGADVSVFNTTRQEMRDDRARDDELTRNFRSTSDLIEVYNVLFSHPSVMGTEVAQPYQAMYAPMAATRGPSDKQHPPLEVHLLSESADADSGRAAEGDSGAALERLREREAAWLARRLVRLLTDGTCLIQRGQAKDASWEPVRPGDIAILFRSTRDVPIYEQALREAALPYYLVVGQGFFNAQEVQDVVMALRAIENGLDDIALVGALRSPLFGLSDETLFWLAQMGPGPWWWRVQTAAQGSQDDRQQQAIAHITGDQRGLLGTAARILEDLRRRKNRLPLSSLVQALLDRTGYTAVLAAQFGGKQLVSNVRKLVELAGQFELEHQTLGQGGLRDFAEHLQRMTTDEVREGQAPVEEEAGDCIKLITYHSAKGLQWPVVVVPDLCRKPGGGGFPPPYRLHPAEGLVVSTKYVVRQNGRSTYWPWLANLIQRINEEEESAENRRLFYVAATRARDLLILSGVARLTQKGTIHGNEARGPLSWINEALQGPLWASEGNQPDERCWQWQDGTLVPQDAPLTTDAAYQPPELDAEESPVRLDTLTAQWAPIAPVSDGQRRFTATDLSLYGHCPRLYELERRLGLPGAMPSFGSESGSTRLSSLEFGEVVHRVLQLVGTGGGPELDRLVPPDARMLRLDTLLDKRAALAAGAIHARVRGFLQSDLYRELFRPTSRLRSEAGLAVVLHLEGRDVLIEGKVDALLETPDGRLHLVDYKTGEHDDARHDEYAVQVGLYCHAIQQATGSLPASASLVYLCGDTADVRALDVPTTTRQAVDAAREAVIGIWQGSFPQRDGECGYCVGARLCHTEPEDEMERRQTAAQVDEEE